MQLPNKLKSIVLTSLLVLSSASADNKSQATDVMIDLADHQGTVTVVRTINGKAETFTESFKIEANTDVDALVDQILKNHGLDNSPTPAINSSNKGYESQGKGMAYVQKSQHVDVSVDDGLATVVIKKVTDGEVETIEQNYALDDNTNIEQLVDDLMAEHGIEIDDTATHKKIIKLDKHIAQVDPDKPRMGFMAKAQDNGWQIISVLSGSGAEDAGIKKGDLITSINGQSTANRGLALTEFIAMDHQAGDVIQVTALRNDEELNFAVSAKVLDSPDILMQLSGENSTWFSSSDQDFKFNSGDLDGMFKGLNVDVEHLDKMIEGFDQREIHVVTTGDADAYFFAGSQMDQWLGKSHHFSTLSAALGAYFGTTEGVLLLGVDQNNKLGLKDGDVIQAINGQAVNSPKEVVKIISGFKTGQAVEIKIMRHQETIYLES